MKKIIFLLSLSVFLFASCTKKSEANINENDNVYIDDLGRSVIVKSWDRVSVLIGSFADVWCLAGGKDSIVSCASDTWTQFDLGLSEDVINIGSVKAPNLEKILSSNPDLIIASSKTTADVSLMESFENMNIPVLYFEVSNFNDYLRMLEVCTSITKNIEAYNKYGLSIKSEIDKAISLQDGSNPKILYVRASNSKLRIKNSEGSVLGEMLKDLGCINIADSNTLLLDNLSLETIIKEDPYYIFCVLQSSTPEKAEENLQKSLLSNPLWNSLTSVKEGRFIMLDQSLYNMKPNARWGEAYLKLSNILYGKN